MAARKRKRTVLRTLRKVLGLALLLPAALLLLLLLFWGNERRNYCEGSCPSWLTAGPIAHRGLCGDPGVDENSLSAFRKAVEAGYAIELDVRYTSDMVPMILHDYNMTRLFGADTQLSRLTYEEARTLTYLNSGEPLPTLEEVLALVDGQVPLLIELKAYHLPGEFEDRVVALLRAYDGPFVIQSNNPLALNYVKKLDPDIPVGLLIDDIPGLPHSRRGRILMDNLFGAICRPAFLVYNCALVEDGELDVYRTGGSVVLGYLFHEDDLTSDAWLSKVDGIIFTQKADEPDP